jgi:thiosulfate reductase/polysulfide reductase chain A
MNDVSRRKFLKVTGAAAGLMAAGNAVLKATGRIAGSASVEKGIRTVPTFCDVCFWKCGAIATVRDGELWKIEGNPIDPLSNGRLCPRGTGGIGAQSDPDRLRSPLLRKQQRGGEAWVEVTWDEAFEYIAQKMQKIKQQYGPEAMAFFAHGIGGNFLKHTMKAYGTPNITAPSFAQCRGPRDVGFRLTFGEDVSSPERTDIRNAKCIVLIGSHLGENMHNSQVQEFADAVGNGAVVIVVDPRFSIAAGKAKHYLPIKPGTDIALLLAWMHVIVTEGIYDKEYVQQHGFGFEQFAASLQNHTPEWAYPETGIDPDIIRTTAREIARYRPATLVHPGRHATWYGDDAQRSRAIALLNALLGSWGRTGGFYTPVSMDVPAYPYPEYPKSERGKVDNPGRKYPFAHETITTGIRDATLTGNPYPVKGWLVYATNLMHALPDEQQTIRAIQNLDLMVVIDVIPTETAGWADVILPESVYLERFDDLNVEWFREPFIALRQPVVPSPHEQKPNWWIAKKLAEHLGLGNFFPWNDIEEYLHHRMTAAGLSYEELKKNGIIRGAHQPVNYDEGLTPAFPTPSGKIEFYSLQLQQAGFDPVPAYSRPAPGPQGYYRLLYGRAPVHSFGRTQSNRILSDMMAENEVWVNTHTAQKHELTPGQYVRLKNQDGIISNRIKVKITERIRPDCVFMVHGFGHNNKMLKHAYGKGASDAGLITRYATDPLMGGTGMNVNFVTFEPAEA